MAEARFNLTVRDDGVWPIADADEEAVVKSIETDSDRAVGIAAASMVESRLQKAILTKCARNEKIESDVFGSKGTLGSFGAKIELACLLGFLTENATKDLKIIQNIRNSFAHRLDCRDFSTESIKHKTDNFTLIKTHVVNRSETSSFIVNAAPKSIPVMAIKSYSERMKVPKSRYLMTVQIFLIAFAPVSVTHKTTPLI